MPCTCGCCHPRNLIVSNQEGASSPDLLVRHVLPARLLHWLMAASVIVLMLTSLLPIFGIRFKWVTIHWITGLVLAAAVIVHILWSVFSWKRLRQMLFWIRDLKDVISTLGWFFHIRKQAPPRTGKYSPAQKLIHHLFAVVVLSSIVTGLLMMVKVDTPFWERDPYWLSNDAWGVIYIIHDAASMILVTMIMLHIYFAIRPEKRFYLRSMVRGFITRDEFTQNHDPDRWRQ